MKRLLVLLSLILISASCTKKDGSGASEEVWATVNGKDIKSTEVMPNIQNDLQELDRQAYELKRRAVEDVIQRRILEEEAKRQNTSVDGLFKQFDNLRDKDVSKEDVAAFLKARNVDQKKLTKQEKESVPQIIRMQWVYEARQKYVNEIRSKANVTYKLKKPDMKSIDVSIDDDPAIGTGKVNVVEFSDFECPFCARAVQRLEEIRQKYGDKVKIVYRDFPLESIHPHAFRAAEAAGCAFEQGKFWEYHNWLFSNQAKFGEGDKTFLAAAKELKLNDDQFKQCLSSGKRAAEIRKDIEDGTKYGVNSTPTFFVNGKAIRGALPLENFSELIDEELAK